MMLKRYVIVLAIGAALAASVTTATAAPSIEAMLEAFVEDFRSDPEAATPFTVAVRVKDAKPSEWHIVCAGRAAEAEKATVTLEPGLPDEPAFVFVTDSETVTRMYEGTMAALTAMGKTYSTDFAPLDIDGMPGLEPTPEMGEFMPRLSFHFWTRGFPEVVKFDDIAYTRPAHGANAVLFYYQKGFRSGYFHIQKGQHVNKPEAEQTNPFPSFIVVTGGTMTARIGGKEVTLEGGEAIYIGPGVSHEFWNDNEETATGVLLMFGEGA